MAPLSIKMSSAALKNPLEKGKIKICPFNQDFPPEQQLQNVQSWDKQAPALLHWKRNVNKA